MVSQQVPCIFFSSRRRHTIFDCDWSSVVCSSDLVDVQLGDVPPRIEDLAGGCDLLDRNRLATRHPPQNFFLLVARRVSDVQLQHEAVDLCFWKWRSEEHTSELQSQSNLVCRLLLE